VQGYIGCSRTTNSKKLEKTIIGTKLQVNESASKLLIHIRKDEELISEVRERSIVSMVMSTKLNRSVCVVAKSQKKVKEKDICM